MNHIFEFILYINCKSHKKKTVHFTENTIQIQSDLIIKFVPRNLGFLTKTWFISSLQKDSDPLISI